VRYRDPLIFFALLFLIEALLMAQREEPARDAPAAETRARALIAEHDRARLRFRKALREAKTEADRSRIVLARPRVTATAGKVWREISVWASAPRLADEILWCFRAAPGTPVATAALETLMRHHRDAKATRELPRMLLLRGHPRAPQLLGELSRSKSWEIRGEAALALAQILAATPAQRLRAKSILREVLRPSGSGGDKASSPQPAADPRQSEELARMKALEARIRRQLFALEHLFPPAPAPALRGPALDGGTLDLQDFRGRVVLVEFWGDW
jgi:hypothetical protein